jgi:hypothetical protein
MAAATGAPATTGGSERRPVATFRAFFPTPALAGGRLFWAEIALQRKNPAFEK